MTLHSLVEKKPLYLRPSGKVESKMEHFENDEEQCADRIFWASRSSAGRDRLHDARLLFDVGGILEDTGEFATSLQSLVVWREDSLARPIVTFIERAQLDLPWARPDSRI
jgi:hypothetical protein